MRDSATNLFRLLENLLHWARLKQGNFDFNPVELSLLQVVDESIENLLGQSMAKSVEIIRNIPPDLNVIADSNMLQSIIRNLISNGVKFTSGGGSVSIDAVPEGSNSVRVSVRDTGIGMDESIIENLFILDKQSKRIGTAGEPSTGLGLLLCKEFISKLGGKLSVESTVGVGSVFSFNLKRGE